MVISGMSRAQRRQLEQTVNEAMRNQVVVAVLLNQAIAARAGLNPVDVQCLNLLTLHGPMTPSRLAEAMAITKGGAITAMIDRLERGGYVARSRESQDRRQVLITPVHGEPLQRLMALFEPIGTQTELLMRDYTDEQLRLILEFTQRTNEAVKLATPSDERARSVLGLTTKLVAGSGE
jgi:DNA-binding MarR family transcriptional regulator